MREGTGVEHDAEAVGVEAVLLDGVDDGALVIALHMPESRLRKCLPERRDDVAESGGAVDVRLALPEQVEIRTVEYEDILHIT